MMTAKHTVTSESVQSKWNLPCLSSQFFRHLWLFLPAPFASGKVKIHGYRTELVRFSRVAIVETPPYSDQSMYHVNHRGQMLSFPRLANWRLRSEIRLGSTIPLPWALFRVWGEKSRHQAVAPSQMSSKRTQRSILATRGGL